MQGKTKRHGRQKINYNPMNTDDRSNWKRLLVALENNDPSLTELQSSGEITLDDFKAFTNVLSKNHTL